MRIKPLHTRFLSLVFAAVCALPVSLGWLTGIFLWTSPLLFLMSLVSGQMVIFSLLGFSSLLIIFVKKRWYCQWLCPVGVLCDAASKSPLKLMAWMPRLGVVLAALILVAALFGVPAAGLLDPIAIFHSFYTGFQATSFFIIFLSMVGLVFVVGINLLSRHIWCTKLCPLGGLQDVIAAMKTIRWNAARRQHTVDLTRRATLGALGGFGLSFFIPKSQQTASTIRPPAALEVSEFHSTCIRCGNCMKACPTDIIQPVMQARDMMSLLTPKVSFAAGYCLPECNTCGAVCPSGAIQYFDQKDKKSLVMGSARIDIKNCLLTEHKECDRCQFYCDYEAITIQASDVDLNAWPHVDSKRCVGCGACVVACPVNVVTIVPI